MGSAAIGKMAGGIGSTMMQIGGAIANSIAAKKFNSQMADLLAVDPKYGGSPYASNLYGLAQQNLNARMPGAAAAERNIYGAQANNQAAVNRLTTDSSQALAFAAAGQGQADAGFNQLRQQEGQQYQNNFNNLAGATQGMTDEERFKYAEDVRRWQDQVNNTMTKYKIKRQGNNDFSQIGAGLWGSDMSGMFGGGSGGGSGSAMGGGLMSGLMSAFGG